MRKCVSAKKHRRKMRDPFQHRSIEELAIATKAELKRQKLLKEAQKLAIKCLNHEDFVKYREQFKLLKKETFDAMIMYNEQDPMKYAFNMRRMADELRQLKLLVDKVEADGNRKVKE